MRVADADGLEIDALVELFAACHRVLAHIGDRDDVFARALCEICDEAEQKLRDFGLVTDPP